MVGIKTCRRAALHCTLLPFPALDILKACVLIAIFLSAESGAQVWSLSLCAPTQSRNIPPSFSLFNNKIFSKIWNFADFFGH